MSFRWKPSNSFVSSTYPWKRAGHQGAEWTGIDRSGHRIQHTAPRLTLQRPSRLSWLPGCRPAAGRAAPESHHPGTGLPGPQAAAPSAVRRAPGLPLPPPATWDSCTMSGPCWKPRLKPFSDGKRATLARFSPEKGPVMSQGGGLVSGELGSRSVHAASSNCRLLADERFVTASYRA